MYRFFSRKMKLSGNLLFLTIGMLLVSLLITVVRMISIQQYQIELGRAGVDFKLSTPLQAWIGYTESFNMTGAGIASIAASFSGDMFSKIVMPFLITLAGVDFFLDDYHSDMHPMIYSRINRSEYYWKQTFYVFAYTFTTEFLFLIVQAGMCLAGSYFWGNNLLSEEIVQLSVPQAAGAVIRLSVYYALLACAAYTASTLIIGNRMMTYIFPVFVSLGSTIIFHNCFRNDPLAMAYFDSGLAHPSMKFYFGFCIIAIIFILVGNALRIVLDRTGNLPEKWDEILT